MNLYFVNESNLLKVHVHCCRIEEAVEILNRLDYIQNETEGWEGKAWYYACCMELILETGA